MAETRFVTSEAEFLENAQTGVVFKVKPYTDRHAEHMVYQGVDNRKANDQETFIIQMKDDSGNPLEKIAVFSSETKYLSFCGEPRGLNPDLWGVVSINHLFLRYGQYLPNAPSFEPAKKLLQDARLWKEVGTNE